MNLRIIPVIISQCVLYQLALIDRVQHDMQGRARQLHYHKLVCKVPAAFKLTCKQVS